MEFSIFCISYLHIERLHFRGVDSCHKAFQNASFPPFLFIISASILASKRSLETSSSTPRYLRRVFHEERPCFPTDTLLTPECADETRFPVVRRLGLLILNRIFNPFCCHYRGCRRLIPRCVTDLSQTPKARLGHTRNLVWGDRPSPASPRRLRAGARVNSDDGWSPQTTRSPGHLC